ncbi:hypothetical protein DAPPUDRAFT_101078 [Daphnia pulex]|uniref:MYND-type domain-containing protein n=1 Tax=Daphnia pulex TaxID=6669 RepID=E9GC92_DAPPU|nr:hypothetical protein DAPPUDRAFT_101078 [Daphnia pulex]|eukprot:EFX82902.1 hypothetical protein DAPPUDRAFT_101078 [Daphnia pulex]
MISPTRCQRMKNFPLYIPYGNFRVRNVLKDFRDQSFGEKTTNSKTAQVLFLGTGEDMRKTLLATTAEHVNNFHFHLNDNCPSIVARNIMMLKILSAQDFDPNKEQDFSFLWDVWYNTEWPEITRKQFLIVLNDLLDGKLPENVTVPDPNHYKSLKKIWKVWYTISSRNQSKSEMLLCKTKMKRSELFITSHETTIVPPRNSDEKITHVKAFSRAVNEITKYLMKRNAIGDLEDSLGRIIEQEFQAFYERGSCRLQNELETVCINSSFLNPDTEQWQVDYASCPFLGYLPLSQDQELITSVKDKILLPTCQKILKDTVNSFRSRIADIQVFFHLEDALEFCFTNANKFDVIDCSSADRIGLANILNAASGRLSNNPGAVLFTTSQDWDTFAPTVELYVEHVLCCPLRMIPTIYGLKLNDYVELGSRYPPSWYYAVPSNLSWQKAIHFFQNIVMSPSSSLTEFLNKLAQKCFVSERFPKPSQVLSYQMAVLERHHYSPLTFHYIVSYMNQRLGGDHWIKDAHLLEIPALFNITRPSHFIHGIDLKCSSITCSGSTEYYVIDNFSLEIKEKSEKIVATFLIASAHNLPEAYCVYVIDSMHHCPLLNFGSLKSMHTEKFHLPHPFSRPTPSPVVVPCPGASVMKVNSCIESEDEFKLKIIFDCNEIVSGLTLSTDQVLPCKSAHQVTISLKQPSKRNSLTLSFPYPILVDEISAILHSTDRFIELVLKKGWWEPWPVEFQSNEEWKWNVDSLKPWESHASRSISKFDCTALDFHLKLQFNFDFKLNDPGNKSSVMEPSHWNLRAEQLNEKEALQNLRRRFKSLLLDPTTEDLKYFVIQTTGSSTTDWCIMVLIHKPLLTSPLGSPVLLLTVLDKQMANILKKQGKLNEETYTKERSRAVKSMSGKLGKIFSVEPYELLLWNLILRLNSTKIVPGSEQTRLLPSGMNNSWLFATFMSPLYVDAPVNLKDFNAQFSTNDSTSANEKCCGACKKVPQFPKRCSRCRSIVYCSVECQRSNWPQHKLLCNRKK